MSFWPPKKVSGYVAQIYGRISPTEGLATHCTLGFLTLPGYFMRLYQEPLKTTCSKVPVDCQSIWLRRPVSIFSPQYAGISAKLEVQAVAKFTAMALNDFKQQFHAELRNCSNEKKWVLKNGMAVDILAAAQGGTCAVIKQERGTCIASYESNIHDLLSHRKNAVDKVDQISFADSFSCQHASLPGKWGSGIWGFSYS